MQPSLISPCHWKVWSMRLLRISLKGGRLCNRCGLHLTIHIHILGTTNWQRNLSTVLYMNRMSPKTIFRWCTRSVDRGLTPCKESGGDIKLVRTRIELMLPSVCRNGRIAQATELVRIPDDKQ